MTQPLDHDGHLVITDDNAHLAESLRSVSGSLWIHTADLSFPMLTQVGGDLQILGASAALPVLDYVGGLVYYHTQVHLPALRRAA